MKVLINTPQPHSKVGKMSTALRQNPIDFVGFNIQEIQTTKRQVGHFLYNKSKLVRNLLITQDFLQQAVKDYKLNLDELEQSLRLYYLMSLAQRENVQ